MPEESTTPDLVELVRTQLEAANRRDIDAFLSVVAPGGTYDASPDGLGVYEGLDAIRALIEDFWGMFDDLRSDVEEILDLGNGVVVAVVRHEGRPAGSTGHVKTHQAYVFIFVDGVVVRVTVYTDIGGQEGCRCGRDRHDDAHASVRHRRVERQESDAGHQPARRTQAGIVSGQIAGADHRRDRRERRQPCELQYAAHGQRAGDAACRPAEEVRDPDEERAEQGEENGHSWQVENVQGEEASIAMFNFGGSGVMASNKVKGANDAISANWSRGTQFVKNVITKSGSGVHTDNNGGFSGVADLIKENTVKECNVNGYGIFVFVPYVSATVESNKISSCSVGLGAYGGAKSGEGPTFSKNVVNGTGASTTNNAGTYGAYLTTDQLGYGFGNLTATLTGNSFSHFNTGMFVTQTTPTTGQPAGGQATITAKPNNSFFSNGTGANGDIGTIVKAEEDWWGCSLGPNMGGKCNTAIGTVTFTPWLTAKP